MAKVVRYNVLEETHSGENAFLIHRPFVMGNPYTHIRNKETKAMVKVKDRDTAINMFSPYFDVMLEKNEAFREEFERMYEAYMKYDTIYLGCYCHVNETCHGDIISQKLRQKAMLEAIKNYRHSKPQDNK